MRLPIFLLTTAALTAASAQIDLSKIMQQPAGGVKVEDDKSPFVPNTFIGSFRMEMHSFKNGQEDKNSPTNMRYWSSAEMTMMKTEAAGMKEGEEMKILTDLKNKHQYMLMTDSDGKKTAMKQRKKNITMDEDKLKSEADVKKTSETREIEGHACTKYIVTTEDGTWTGWVAEDMKAPFEDMARSAAKGNERMQQNMHEMPGFPLEFEWVSTDGKDKTVSYIRDLRYGSVEESVFSLDGYEIMDMTGMPGY